MNYLLQKSVNIYINTCIGIQSEYQDGVLNGMIRNWQEKENVFFYCELGSEFYNGACSVEKLSRIFVQLFKA